MGAEPQTLVQLFERTLARADKPFIIGLDGLTSYTFRQAWDAAGRMAVLLANLGVASETRDVHCLGIEPDWAQDVILRMNYPEDQTTSACFHTHTVYSGGTVKSETALGFVEGYARWIDWRA